MPWDGIRVPLANPPKGRDKSLFSVYRIEGRTMFQLANWHQRLPRCAVLRPLLLHTFHPNERIPAFHHDEGRRWQIYAQRKLLSKPCSYEVYRYITETRGLMMKMSFCWPPICMTDGYTQLSVNCRPRHCGPSYHSSGWLQAVPNRSFGRFPQGIL